MKHILSIFFCCTTMLLSAQDTTFKKSSTIAFHAFYNDFNTAQKIRTTSLSNVLNNKLWSRLNEMQMGFGFSYLKGITKKIDATATIDASSVDYLFKNGISNGSSKLLLDISAGANIKMLTDNRTLVPYISGGLGFSLYDGKTGFYLPVGAGIQFDIFKEAFVFTNIQYRLALSSAVNYHFYYSVGIAVALIKKKITPPAPKPLPAPDTVVKIEAPVEIKLASKDIAITVTDVQTGQPLPYVEVVISGPDGTKMNGSTDANGAVIFKEVTAADYAVSGMLNGINTTTQVIEKTNFEGEQKFITINISHSDPRFTLSGKVINKATNTGEGGVEVNITNETQSSINRKQSQPGVGIFTAQLEAGSDFSIVGKKANYISNIEKLSTMGLNRSATLYVKLELSIEEASVGKDISLKNIYYDLGKTAIRASASSDIDKLLQFLTDNPGIKIEIASYTDSRGSDAANQKLSQARAQAVVDFLISKGIATERLLPKGYGETKLVNGCSNGIKCTEDQHQQNRRTEFKVVN